MKPSKEEVEAGLVAEWGSFDRIGKSWPEGCPPGARGRWREAFTAGLRAAAKVREAAFNAGKVGRAYHIEVKLPWTKKKVRKARGKR